MKNVKVINREKRHARVRSKVSGTAARPRLLVQKRLVNNYAQLIDDENKVVLAGISDMKVKGKGTKTEKAKQLGIDIAKKAEELKITEVVFDRNGYKYHGRVKAVAEGAREGGLKF